MKKTVVLMGFMTSIAVAQGPTLSYLTDPDTRLSFAECRIYLDGGSSRRISFLPVVNRKGAPCGTERYTKNIRLKAPIVFVGSGVGDAAYAGLDVSGKAVLLSYDFPEDAGVSLEERVYDAVRRDVAGIVLFSMRDERPFPIFREEDLGRIPEIPIIAIGRRDAAMILASAGRDGERVFESWQSEGTVRSEILISKLDLRIDGRFEVIETDNFIFAFEPRGISREAAAALADTSEKAVQFDLQLFREGRLRWKKAFVAYYADYDSKVFFLHHWGKGMSGDAGVFMVYDGGAPDFELAVHEYAHTLIAQNWGGSSSFLSEGIGKYAEAMAGDKAKNHRETAVNLLKGQLLPLQQMTKIEIGSHADTETAYPAAGSFVQFLLERFSLRQLKAAYQSGGGDASWATAYGKDLRELEQAWLNFLRSQ